MVPECVGRGWVAREVYIYIKNATSAGGTSYEAIVRHVYGDDDPCAIRASHQAVFRLRLRGVPVVASSPGPGHPAILTIQEESP